MVPRNEGVRPILQQSKAKHDRKPSTISNRNRPAHERQSHQLPQARIPVVRMDVSRDEGDSKVIVRHLSEGKKDVEAEDYHLS